MGKNLGLSANSANAEIGKQIAIKKTANFFILFSSD